VCRQVVRFIKDPSSQGLPDFHTTIALMIMVFVIKWGFALDNLIGLIFLRERERGERERDRDIYREREKVMSDSVLELLM